MKLLRHATSLALFSACASFAMAQDHPAGPVKKETFNWDAAPAPGSGEVAQASPGPGKGTPKRNAAHPVAADDKKPAATPPPAPAPAPAPQPAEPAKETPAEPTAPPAPTEASSTKPAANDEPARFAAAFFAALQKNKVDDAYANLTKGSKIAERPDEMKSLKEKTNQAIEMFGAVQGFDMVESKAVGPHILRRTYLTLGKEFPLRWRFYFYKADNRWRLVDLRVDDRLTGIFDEPEDAREESSQPK